MQVLFATKEPMMTMKQSELLRQAIRLWSNPLVPKQVQRHNQRAWLRSVQMLGDKWLIAKPVGRVQ
jgi:hypothetical protein